MERVERVAVQHRREEDDGGRGNAGQEGHAHGSQHEEQRQKQQRERVEQEVEPEHRTERDEWVPPPVQDGDDALDQHGCQPERVRAVAAAVRRERDRQRAGAEHQRSRNDVELRSSDRESRVHVLDATLGRSAGDRLKASMHLIHSHEVRARPQEYGERVSKWRPYLDTYGGDILLATVLAVAAAHAAAGATSSQPLQTVLVLFAFAAAGALAFRRDYPVEVFTVAVFATGFFTVVYNGYWPFVALLAFYSLAAHAPRRTALLAGAVGLVALGIPIARAAKVGGLETWEHGSGWSHAALLAGRLAPLVAAWILGDNMRTRRAYLRAVEGRAEQLEREREANARRAAAEEQARIAREVHDVVAHNLSVIIVQATAAERVFDTDPRSAERAVRAVGRTARQALDDLRGVLGVVADTDLAPQPTLDCLDPLLDQVRAAGLDVALRTEGTPRPLPSALGLSAYRIIQEALTNTLRHANAVHATVSVRYAVDTLTLEVVDDGTVEVAQNGTNGHGLIGMRQRAATFGGEVETGPNEGGGFRVSARLPLEAAEA